MSTTIETASGGGKIKDFKLKLGLDSCLLPAGSDPNPLYPLISLNVVAEV